MQFAINFAGMYMRTEHTLTHTLQEISACYNSTLNSACFAHDRLTHPQILSACNLNHKQKTSTLLYCTFLTSEDIRHATVHFM